jgi:hypothetical protein
MKSRVSRARKELASLLSVSPADYFEVDAVFSAAVASGERVAWRL